MGGQGAAQAQGDWGAAIGLVPQRLEVDPRPLQRRFGIGGGSEPVAVRASQFQHRLPWISKERLEADMLPFPAHVTDGELPVPERAPDVGEHTDEVLRDAGYDQARIEALRKDGVVF